MWTAAEARVITVYILMSFLLFENVKLHSQGEKQAHIQNLKQRQPKEENRVVGDKIEMGKILADGFCFL